MTHKLIDNDKTYIMDDDAMSLLMAHGMLYKQPGGSYRLSSADELRSDPGSAGVNNPRPEAVMAVMRVLLHLPLEGGTNNG